MEVIGRSRGQVILNASLEHVFPFFANQKKILSFNPFCREVSPTEIDNVYRWDFEIMDPQSHPIHLIFFVEQIEQFVPNLSPETHSQIFWREYPVVVEGEMPNDHTFIGRANGEMLLKPLSATETFVNVSMQIHVDFNVPVLLRFFPEPIIKVMSEAAMSFGMQHVSRKMLERIRQEFACTILDTTNFGTASVRN
ncbi:MAG: hypothetical protein RML35_12635 [Chloroherpetonaceae bacterium]|nr:hypothetical protein [Chloroherpetonaceae bacterium]